MTRVAVVTDALVPPARGNGTTVARWIDALRDADIDLEVVRPGGHARVVPDLVHGYHLLRAGPAAVDLARNHGVPLVMSLGGTDIHMLRDVKESADHATMRGVLSASAVVTGAFAAFEAVVRGAVDASRAPFAYTTVRRAVHVDEEAGLLARPRARLEIVLPAGLRPVKDPLLAVRMADVLHAASVPLRLRIFGAALDASVAKEVKAAAQERPYVTVERRPHLAMAAAYLRSHVVWNTSLHEGGSNAVLEGLAHGCQAWIRDVPGNREYAATPGGPVHCFDPADEAGLVRFHRAALAESDAQRGSRWRRTRAWLKAHHALEDERQDLLTAYAAAT